MAAACVRGWASSVPDLRHFKTPKPAPFRGHAPVRAVANEVSYPIQLNPMKAGLYPSKYDTTLNNLNPLWDT